LQASKYVALEALPDGRRIEIRALRPEDRAGLDEIVSRSSAESLYRRFFAVKRHFTDREIDALFANIDFVTHVVVVAQAEEQGRRVIVGGGRYVVVEPGRAEVAFFVIDSYQGQGLGGALMRHITAIARQAGLKDLTAEVLPANAPMLKVFEKSGLPMRTTRGAGVVHVELRLT